MVCAYLLLELLDLQLLLTLRYYRACRRLRVHDHHLVSHLRQTFTTNVLRENVHSTHQKSATHAQNKYMGDRQTDRRTDGKIYRM